MPGAKRVVYTVHYKRNRNIIVIIPEATKIHILWPAQLAYLLFIVRKKIIMDYFQAIKSQLYFQNNYCMADASGSCLIIYSNPTIECWRFCDLNL
jgi:hypothetical protein